MTIVRAVRGVVAVVAVAGLAMAGMANVARGARTYTVRRGDTLTSIAARLGVTMDSLRAANHLANANLVWAGERLVVPGRTHAHAHGPLAPVAWPSPGAPTYPTRLLAHPTRLALRASFQRWAAVTGAPAGLLEAVAWMESGWQNRVVSPTGAIGVGQLEPSTVAFASGGLLGLPGSLDPHNPDQNIHMSAAYLAWLLRQTRGDVAYALGAYYQGLLTMRRQGPWDDTRQYVMVVGELWQQFRSG